MARRTGPGGLWPLGLLITLALSTGAAADKDLLRPPPKENVPPEFFGLHIHPTAADAHHDKNMKPWPVVAFSSWRLWDYYAAWPDLEPERGVWNFTGLDRYVALAHEHHVRLLLPLGLSPQWASSRPQEPSAYQRPGWAAEPADIEDWKAYVRTVAERYRGVIREYEIWNEPNLKEFFTGDEAKMLALARTAYAIIKSVDPGATIVSPAPTTSGGLAWLDRYLALGGANYADVIGFHLYVAPEPPEAIYALALRVREILRKHGVRKPLWNTESGWLGKLQPFDPTAATYVARAYLLNWAAGVGRFYWYDFNSTTRSVRMMGADQFQPTPPALAYARVRSWLVGARMLSCVADPEGVWTAALKRPHGRKAWVLWASGQAVRRPRPRAWAGRRIYTLVGKGEGFPISETLDIGPSPVLIQ